MDTSPLPLSQLVHDANLFFSRGLYAEALAAYQQAQVKAPTHPDIYLGIAASQLKLGQVAPGIEAFEKALKLSEAAEHPRLRRGVANMLSEAGAHGEAARYFQPIIGGEADDLLPGLIYLAKADRPDDVLSVLEKAITSFPDVWQALIEVPALDSGQREAILARQERLLAPLQDSLRADMRSLAANQIRYLEERNAQDPSEHIAAWQTALHTLHNTRSVQEAIEARKALRRIGQELGGMTVASLQAQHPHELRTLEDQIFLCDYGMHTLPKEDINEYVQVFLDQAQAHQQLRQRGETALEAFARLPALLAAGEPLAASLLPTLIGYADQQARMGNVWRAQEIAESLENRFPQHDEVAGLVARVGIRKSELKEKALMWGKWAGMAVATGLVIWLGLWGIRKLNQVPTDPLTDTPQSQSQSPQQGQTGTPIQSPPVAFPRARINDFDEHTNVRTGPGTQHSILTRIYPNQEFEILSQNGNWWQVQTADGQRGHVHRNQITQSGSRFPGHFPQASEYFMSEEELRAYSKSQRRIMRNEIFARHGYRFNSPDLDQHFRRHAWYQPRYENVDDRLSDIEKANAALMRRLE